MVSHTNQQLLVFLLVAIAVTIVNYYIHVIALQQHHQSTIKSSSSDRPKSFHFKQFAKSSLARTLHRNQLLQRTQSLNKHGKSRIIFYALIYGESAWRSDSLKLYLLSVAGAGFDVVLIGEGVTFAALDRFPANVYYKHVPWNALVERLITKMDSHDSAHLTTLKIDAEKKKQNSPSKYSRYYKATDFKPIIGWLFPEFFTQYEYFGWSDVDMVFGAELMRQFNRNQWQFDVSNLQRCGNRNKGDKGHGIPLSHGPLGIFRNEWYTNHVIPLLRSNHTHHILNYVFGQIEHTNFGEEGRYYPKSRGWQYSFSGLLSKFIDDTKQHQHQWLTPNVLQMSSSLRFLCLSKVSQWVWDQKITTAQNKVAAGNVTNEPQENCIVTVDVNEGVRVTRLYNQFCKPLTLCHFQLGKHHDKEVWKKLDVIVDQSSTSTSRHTRGGKKKHVSSESKKKVQSWQHSFELAVMLGRGPHVYKSNCTLSSQQYFLVNH